MKNKDELNKIIQGDNFSEEIEQYLFRKITTPENQNPFIINEDIGNKLLLKTIIYCTVTLANLIYILHDEMMGEL